MDSPSSAGPVIKKQEDDDKNEKRDIKPVPKTLNRVPRACNACRKQKMRCEGADNPPCEAGLERIRNLEAHVADIRVTQSSILSTLSEILHSVRGGGLPARSPSTFATSSFQQSSPSISTPTAGHQHVSPPSGANSFSSSSSSVKQHRPSLPNVYQVQSSPSGPPDDMHSAHLSPMYGNYGQGAQGGQPYNPHTQSSQGPVLPPFSSIQAMGPPVSQQSNLSSLRYQQTDPSFQRTSTAGKHPGPSSGSKRQAPPSSNVTSADSSDIEEDDDGLPATGLVAPWEVLRGLADVAIERASKAGLLLPYAPSSLTLLNRTETEMGVNLTVEQGHHRPSDNPDPTKGERHAIRWYRL
ncbi:hypothetical protein NLJ89_g12074 [Agrocybe chaxingu]|uniref:Zn(2)-C6 fungal-type domain-containing protein n=1 Tax=Agrocybe chaxingu TaxID=84603 RepID=A0A9W8JNT3_9AGAR|nr:hypothetical protein NLJ89_g12074 [Agrocybe chaxingu]